MKGLEPVLILKAGKTSAHTGGQGKENHWNTQMCNLLCSISNLLSFFLLDLFFGVIKLGGSQHYVVLKSGTLLIKNLRNTAL